MNIIPILLHTQIQSYRKHKKPEHIICLGGNVFSYPYSPLLHNDSDGFPTEPGVNYQLTDLQIQGKMRTGVYLRILYYSQ